MSVSSWLTRFRGDTSVVQRGLKLIERGELAEAKEVLVAGDTLFEDSALIKYHLAYLMMLQQSFEKAVAYLREGGIRHTETTDDLFRWAHKMETVRHNRQAVALLELIAENFPGKIAAKAYFHAARLYRFENQKQQSVEAIVRSLENGNHPHALSMFYAFRSEEERLALMKNIPRITKLTRQRGRDASLLNMAIADIYQQNKDFDSAKKFVAKTRDFTTWKGKRRTTGKVRLPGYIIIGTTKSGTTSVFHTLAKHPQIYNAIRKEVHFFDFPEATEAWYRSHFPKLPSEVHAVTGEATPNYLYFDCMDRVKKIAPNAKLICLLREPAERSISQYFQARRHGGGFPEIDPFFDLRPYEAIMRKPDEQIEKSLFAISSGKTKGNNTISFSLYYYYLRKWFQTFDNSNLMLINFDDYRDSPQTVLKEICQFLDVDEFDFAELGQRYKGDYDDQDPSLNAVRERLRDFYTEPNRLLREEFGIEFHR